MHSGRLRRTLSDRGEEIAELAGSTIRKESRGVVGLALVQSFLAGLGFLVAGIPAAGFLTLLALGAEYHSDRTSDRADTDRRVELDSDGDQRARCCSLLTWSRSVWWTMFSDRLLWRAG
jgi:hypothetical protein